MKSPLSLYPVSLLHFGLVRNTMSCSDIFMKLVQTNLAPIVSVILPILTSESAVFPGSCIVVLTHLKKLAITNSSSVYAS